MALSEIIKFENNKKPDGRDVIKGLIEVHGVIFKFSLNQQNRIMYELRGTISALDANGTVASTVMIKDEEREVRKISSSIYVDSADDERIKKHVIRKAESLYNSNAKKFEAEAGVVISPETITVIRAVDRYGKRFINDKHRKASKESRDNMLKMLQRISVKLPHTPMADILTSDINKALDKGVSARAKTELRNFWDYCLQNHFIIGKNPIPKAKKKRRTPSAIKKKANRIDRLSISQEDTLFGILRQKNDGAACAVALMISGFSPKEIAGMRWKDIRIENKADFVVVTNLKPDFASATHNYSRPTVPQSAEILITRQNELVKRFGKSKTSELPVAGKARDPSKCMDANRIIKEAKDLLVGNFMSKNDYVVIANEDMEVAAATRVLRATYKRDLIERCNLGEDPGLLKFLLGESLAKDTTADAYTAFTSPEGEKRIMEIFKCLREEVPIDVDAVKDENPELKILAPKTTRQYARGFVELILQEGESIYFASSHGLEISYAVEDM